MADKVFLKSFAGAFTGINAESSALEGDSNSVGRAVNYEWAVSNNLRGRCGSQIAASTGNFFGLNTHFYSRTVPAYKVKYQSAAPVQSSTAFTADGSTVTELLALNQDLFVLDTYSIPITVVSGSLSITQYSQVSSTSNINFNINQTGAPLFTYATGTGIDASYKTVYDLLIALGASITITRDTCPPYALVNGNQTVASSGRSEFGGYTYQITVTAGHTFYPGDAICWLDNANRYAAGVVSATSATTLTILGGMPTITVLTGQVMGYLCAPAAALPIATAISSATSPFNLTFSYWRWAGNRPGWFTGAYDYYRDTSTRTFRGSNYHPPVITSASGCAYIAISSDNSRFDQKLMKYDGSSVYRAGLPMPWHITSAYSAGALTGTFRYKAYWRRVDAQGNIIEGRPTVPITLTPVAQNVTFTAEIIVYYNMETDGDIVSAGNNKRNHDYATGYCYAAETKVMAAAATTLKVDNGAGGRPVTIKVGDPICFLDSLGTFYRDWITSIDGSAATTTITISGSYNGASHLGITINSGQQVSVGLSLVLLRTTDGGTTWYQLAELPNASVYSSVGNVSYLDSTTDTALSAGTVFTDPDVGKEHDPPPICTLVCQHQGGLVVAGGNATPNSVNFSSADGIEYMPLASNSFDVPTSRPGAISAIYSDTTDRLSVFKYDSYYDVVGDLDGGSFTVNVVNEGDYGIVSQGSIQRVNGDIIGLSKLGFVAIYNGYLDNQSFRVLNARIINQTWFTQGAVACNDSFARNYICAIPTSNNSNLAANTFVLDYSRSALSQGGQKRNYTAFERSYGSGMSPSSGLTIYNDALYTLSGESTYSAGHGGSVFRRLYRFNGDSPTGNDGDSYIDNTVAINHVLETQALNLGEPSVFKAPTRLRVFSIPNDYIVEGWVAFSVAVKSSIFPDPSYFGSSFPGGITSTLTFSGINNWYEDLKLSGAKSLVLMLQFTTNTIRESPFLSGYEIAVPLPYEKEDLQK